MNAVRTGRLVLEPQVAAHAEEMFRVLGDPAIYEHENDPPGSVDWLRDRFARLEARRSPDGAEQWLNWVLRLRSGEAIGYVQATVFAEGRAAIAYVLGSAFWGRGLGREAVSAMIAELVANHGVRTLSAVLKQENGRSLRLLHHLRFVPAGATRQAEIGVEQDEVAMVRSAQVSSFFDGGCGCRAVRYRMESRPMVVHCCHCRWCQRETGASFALNAMIESDRLAVLAGAPERVRTPSESGVGQTIVRCPSCRIALWSHYGGSGPLTAFVRVGTLDEPDRWPPDVHIFTASKQPWVVLPAGAAAFDEYYERLEDVWPAEGVARRQALMPAILAWRAAQPPQPPG